MSHDYAGSLNLHSRKKPVSTRKEGDLKGGIKRDELSAKSQLIFDALNNKNEQGVATDAILDANEMQSFWDMLRTAAKDDTLGGREAGRLLKDLGLKELKKEDLYAFINELYGESEDIDTSLVDDEGTIIINYKEDEDGNTVQERVHTDHTSEVETTDSENTVTTQFLTADNHLSKLTVVKENNDSETTTFTDEHGNVVLDNENNSVPQHMSRVINNNGAQTTADIDYENGQPASAVIVEGTKTSNYVYQEGKPVLASTVENLGNDLQRTTKFEWTENGHVEHITEPNRTIDKTVVNFPTNDNQVVPLTTQEVIKQGTTTTTNNYDYQNSIKYENIVEENGNQTQNIYGIVPNEGESGVNYVKLQQTKVVDGKQYQVQYDGQGNTCGIIVQFGENPAKIAQKFGCTVEELFAANPGAVHGKGRNKYFNVGDEIKIPRELEADTRTLQGRDSREVAIAKYQRYQAEQERKKQLRAMGWDGTDYRQGETIEYGGKKYTILGRKTNRERFLVQDSQGRVYTASHDNLILKDSYVATTDYYDFHPERRVEIGGKTYVKAPDDPNVDANAPQQGRISNGYRDANGEYHRDQFGRDVVIDYNGRIAVTSGSIDYGHNNGRYILSNNYLTASDIFVDSKGTAGSNCYGVNGTKAVTINGETFYFATNGFAQQNTEAVEAQIAENISADIIDAADGPCTDNEKLEGAVSAILTPSIKARVDVGIRAHGDSDWTDVETLIYDESNGEKYYRQMNRLVKSGAYTETERASQVATMLDHELHGGLGITRNGCVREILTTIDTPERRQAVDREMASMNRYSGLQTYEGSTVLAAIRDDGFDAEETDRWGAQLIGQKAYKEAVLKLDANGQPMRDNHGNLLYEDAGEQQYINNMVGRLCFDYDSEESLHAGLEAINTDNFNTQGPSASYLYFADRCVTENAKRGYQEHFTDQEAVDVYIYGRSAKDGKLDLDQNEACFTLLYNDEYPPRTLAECALSRAREGDYTQLFSSTDSSVYDIIERELNAGEVPGCTNLQELYQTAKRQSKSNSLSIEAGALLSGRIPFTDQEKVDICIRIIEAQHANQSGEATAIESGLAGSHGVIKDNLKYYQQLLFDIISTNPDIAEEVKQRVQQLDLTYWNGNKTFSGPNTNDMKGGILTQIDNAYNEAVIISDTPTFTDENGNVITDPQEISRLINENKASLYKLRTYVATLERAFKIGVDQEGGLSDAANAVVHNYGWGTDRFDVEQEYRNAKRLLSRFEAAAEGRLRDRQGNIISLRDLSEQTLASCQSLEQTNNDYKTSISYAKMGIILAPVIAVTTVVSGGTAAASWGAGATALAAGGATFATEYGLSMLELSTSETGNTAEARWNALEQAVIDGGSVVVGAKAMQLAQTIKLANPAIQGILRLTTVVAADVGMGAAGEYLISGEVTVNGVVMNAIFSATGNLIGYRSLNHNADPHAPNLLDQSSPSVLDVATVDGTTLSGGKFNPEKFGTAVTEVQSSVANGLTPEQHVHLLNEASLHQSSGAGAQGKTFTHIVEDGTGVFIGGKHGDIDINAETNIAKLQEFKKEVAGWNDPNRDIDGILAMIDGRIEHLNAHPELIGTPVQSQVLDLYNAQLVQQTDALLAPTGKNGKNFKIGESDTSLIIQRINKTNSLEDLDAILAGIEHRRLGGTKQSLIDDMLKAVDSRKLQLRPEIDMDDFNTLISTKNSTGKGLNEGEIFDVVRLIENSSDADFAQIETIINSNPKIKKQTQIKNALNARRAKVGETPANTAAHVEEPAVAPHDEPTSNVSHTSDEPNLHPEEVSVENSSVHTDETPSVAKTSEEIHQSVSQDIDVIDTEIPVEHKSAWTKIKNELNDIQASLRNGVKNLGTRCESVLRNLKNLASKLSPGTLKTKLQKLIADFKLQLMDKGIMKPKNCTLTKSIVNADGTTRTVEFTYDTQGLETKRVYKNQDGTFGGEVNYTYDANNKVKSEVLKDIDGNITENYYQDGEIAKIVRKDAEGNLISQVDLKDEIFVSVENLNPENVQAFLKEKNINPEELMFNGNGAIKYTKDGITYQIHYKDGKLTALRIKDIGGNRSYYAYDASGKKSQISRDEFLDLKTASDRARTSAAQEAYRAQQAKESAYTRGQFDSNDYTGRTIDELRVSMQEKLNLFSANSQQHILDSLMSTNSCRLQKNGIEYQFTRNRRTGKVTVNEYKINEKYNINEIIHDKYNTEKTYEVENADDIYWAIIDKLNIFSDNTQNNILATLKKGQVFTCTKNGIHYEFSINNNKISVKEYNYQAYQNDYYRRSNGTNSNSAHNSESANPESSIPKSPKNQWETGNNTYTDEQLGILEYFIDNYADKIQHKRLTSDETSVLAKLLDIEPNDIIILQKGKDSPEAKRLYRQLSIKYHPDKNPNDKVAGELIKIISSLYN